MVSEDGRCEVKILRLPQDAAQWNYVNEYFKLRKSVFIEQLEWSLNDAEGLEFEQYDTYDTTYVVCLYDGEVVGGARLRRSDQSNGLYSYMIRDACLGLLPGLPTELCFETPPLSQDVWELTRMINNGPQIFLRFVLEAVNGYLRGQNAKECLFLGSPAFLRVARKFEWPVSAMGPVCGNQDGRFMVVAAPVRS